MINTFLPGKLINTVIPFLDENNQPVTPVSALVRIVDQNDSLIDEQNVTNLSGGEAFVITTADHNQLELTEKVGVRVLTLYMENASGQSFSRQAYYYLKREQFLEIGKNSIVSFAKALSHLPSMAGLSWNGNRPLLEGALIEAYERICSFPIHHKFFPKHSLHLMTAQDWASLNPTIREAFEKAQVAEAFELIAEDPTKSLRDQRVFSRSIGESTTTFFSQKAFDRGISKRAWGYIARYVNSSVVIGR